MAQIIAPAIDVHIAASKALAPYRYEWNNYDGEIKKLRSLLDFSLGNKCNIILSCEEYNLIKAYME